MNEILSSKEKKDFQVCVAEEGDAEELLDVLYKTWLLTYPNEDVGITVDDIEDRFRGRLTEEGVEKRRKQLREQSDTVKTFVVRNDERIVALSVVSKNEENNRLIAIYVLPEYQGKGIGKILWNQALKFFDKTKDISVEVATYNTKAIAFYKQIGFQDTGKRFSKEGTRMKSGAVIPEMEMKISRKINV